MPLAIAPSMTMTSENLRNAAAIASAQASNTQAVYAPAAYKLESVNKDYVASFVNPDTFKVRRPMYAQVMTALSKGAVTYPVTTNNQGACGFYVMPSNLAGNGTFGGTYTRTAFQNNFVLAYNGNQFDPSVGYPSTITNNPGYI